jgi:hypothetical protein
MAQAVSRRPLTAEASGKNVEESCSDLTWSIVPAFGRRDWEKPWETLITIVGFWAEIWNRDLPKTKHVQLGDHELASGDWREGEVLFPL